ncbi:ATP-binding cassette domain-containing protein [Halomarina oriensis]|uniref:ABC transporter ATP-binding protein n=1 Tax=Halomarina oriensis TaxID=671145 RepID=UPI0034A45F7E
MTLVAAYDPPLTALIVLFGCLTAALEGVGVGLLVPIVDVAQGSDVTADAGGVVGVFYRGYQFLGVPFTLEYMILGVSVAMTCRYLSSFAVDWSRGYLQTTYIRDVQSRAFEHALRTRVGFFDARGSDEVLNAIITQTKYAGNAIRNLVYVLEQGLLSLVYLGFAFYISPALTVVAFVSIGGITYLVRNVVEPGFSVGDRVADANESIQTAVQAGTQGIRPVKLFGVEREVLDDYHRAVEAFADASITLHRNDSFVGNVHQLLLALAVFGLVFLALRFTTLSFAGLAVFLFVMFRLAPRVSNLNRRLYTIESDLPHVARTEAFVDELAANEEDDGGSRTPPRSFHSLVFDDVTFSYRTGDPVLNGLSLELGRGKFVALVGQSGSGKSTVVSLLTRFYDPDGGEIRLDGTSIDEFELTAWRSRIAVVRQDPFMFDDTLRQNLTLGRRDATDADLERVCRIAQVDEFLTDLPRGFETPIGENGVQLSGGQRQRVALARALLKEADVLVLDEATSNLDTDLEREVQREIERLEEYTVVAIAHRLSTVRNADCIYTVEDGRVVESGTHARLVEREGTYARLYAMQAGD